MYSTPTYIAWERKYSNCLTELGLCKVVHTTTITILFLDSRGREREREREERKSSETSKGYQCWIVQAYTASYDRKNEHEIWTNESCTFRKHLLKKNANPPTPNRRRKRNRTHGSGNHIVVLIITFIYSSVSLAPTKFLGIAVQAIRCCYPLVGNFVNYVSPFSAWEFASLKTNITTSFVLFRHTSLLCSLVDTTVVRSVRAHHASLCTCS